MKKIVSMWRMTSDLDKGADAFHRFVAVDDSNQPLVIYKQKKDEYIRGYAKRKGMSVYRASSILKDCLDMGYIVYAEKEQPPEHYSPKEELLEVKKGKGTDLIDTAMGFPVGLVEALWEKHGVFISGAATGIVGSVVVFLAKWVWHHYAHIPHLS